MNFNRAEFQASYGLAGQLPASDRAEIAFAGRSNVGKSSAINRILNRKGLARVSSVPGKTATINFYRVGEKEAGICLVDLPGYGYAKVARSEQHRWSELMEGYFAQDRELVLTVLLVDGRHPASALDIQMADFLIDKELPFLVLLTKMDKLNQTQRARRLQEIRTELPCGDQLTILPFSSETGEGVSELRQILADVSATEDE